MEQLTDIESEIKYREAELDDARDDLEQMEQRAANLGQLTDDREKVQSDLEELRTRKESIKRATREEFDEAIRDILDRFETGFETARLTSEFELVVARDGRRAELDALSEGELELLGFVAALAGYEAFDVAEISPMLLVDQVGGLDEQNLHTLVEYLEPRTEYLVFTAYPAYESMDANVIDPQQWKVTTHA
jgi:predicted  nucleic acid-binding Zn-ribbon protein